VVPAFPASICISCHWVVKFDDGQTKTRSSLTPSPFSWVPEDILLTFEYVLKLSWD
jgi:hypothetical protein